MSVKVLTYVLENSAQKGNELLTLIVLADHANESGICWPSIERIGKLIRADARTARRCIRRLEKSGELKVRRGDGNGGTNLYWVPMQENLDLFPEGPGVLPPGTLPSRTHRADAPDRAVSAEPSGTVIKKPSGRASPSPVAQAFKVYSDGIQKRYGAPYPPSARANGMLSTIAGRIGREHLVAVVQHYLGHSEPFYARVKHKLDYLVRDCEALHIEAQRPKAAPVGERARVYFTSIEGRRFYARHLYPTGEAKVIARTAMLEHSAAPSIEVVVEQHGKTSSFKPSELAA